MRRLQKAELPAINAAIERIVKALPGPSRRWAVPPSYGAKVDFGDHDVLLEVFEGETPEMMDAWLRPIILSNTHATHFDPEGTYSDQRLSFDWRSDEDRSSGVQVDFLWTKSATFDCTLDYYSYNDLGNYVGKLARMAGAQYGEEGLWFNIRDPQHSENTRIERQLITSDTQIIHELLGLDHARFLQGFETLDEVFAFVTASPWFHPHSVQLDRLDGKSRRRDQKRPNYMKFLGWIEERSERWRPEDDYLGIGKEAAQSRFLDLCERRFPGTKAVLMKTQETIAGDWEKAKAEALVNKERREWITRWAQSEGRQVQGVELGDFLRHLEQRFEGKANINELLASLPHAERDAWLDQAFANHRKGKNDSGALPRLKAFKA